MLHIVKYPLPKRRRIISLFIFPLLLFSLIELNAVGQNVNDIRINYLRMNEVNSKAARHFLSKFPQATTTKWIREPDVYIASFVAGNSKAKAYYDNNGNFICCLKHCPIEEMDLALKATIINRFPECKILNVTEFINLEKQAYFINIKCGEYFKTLCCNDQGIEVTESFKEAGL